MLRVAFFPNEVSMSKPPPGIRTDGGVRVDGVRRGLGAPRCHTKDCKFIETRCSASSKFK